MHLGMTAACAPCSDTEAAIFHAPGGDRDVLMMAKTFEKGDRVEVSACTN